MARRFGTAATFYKYAVIDGILPANPAAAVTRPKVTWEGQKRTVLHPLELATLLAARRPGPNDHALVCLLGMLGLRVSEACATDITDLRHESGYELLHVLGKDARPADIPLPIPVLRAVREAVDCRSTGPIRRTCTGRRMDRAGASRALTRAAHAAGISRPISPRARRQCRDEQRGMLRVRGEERRLIHTHRSDPHRFGASRRVGDGPPPAPRPSRWPTRLRTLRRPGPPSARPHRPAGLASPRPVPSSMRVLRCARRSPSTSRAGTPPRRSARSASPNTNVTG